MDEFPALAEMGITRPRQITRYTLTQVGMNDVLRIHYKREKGSFLPKSRKYQFGRHSKAVITDSGKHQLSEVYEISPFLLRAVAELDCMVNDQKTLTESREVLLHQIDELERSVYERLSELRAEIEKCTT